MEWYFQKALFSTLAAVDAVVPNWPGSRTLVCLKQSKHNRCERSRPLNEVSERGLAECPVWDGASPVRVLSAGEELRWLINLGCLFGVAHSWLWSVGS